MEYYKTIGGMLSSAFEERGMLDDSGNPIKATEKPMTEGEHIKHRQNQIVNKTSRFKIPPQFTDCDNCQRSLTECQCGVNQMPVCNVCGNAQIDCKCDEYSYGVEI